MTGTGSARGSGASARAIAANLPRVAPVSSLALSVGALVAASFGCSGGTQFHPLPSQVDILESHRSAHADSAGSSANASAHPVENGLEGKIDESLAALYTLLERQSELQSRIEDLERRSGVVVPGEALVTMSELDEDIRSVNRSLTRTLERERPDVEWGLEFEGETKTVTAEACADAWQTPSDALPPLFCLPPGTAVFRCESFDRAWTRGLVYHRGVVHEVYVRGEMLSPLESNRTGLTR